MQQLDMKIKNKDTGRELYIYTLPQRSRSPSINSCSKSFISIPSRFHSEPCRGYSNTMITCITELHTSLLLQLYHISGTSNDQCMETHRCM